ncbi:unnamed protein product, partial [Iphiclides podalirius]
MGKHRKNYYKQKQNKGRFTTKQKQEISNRKDKKIIDDACSVAATSGQNFPGLVIQKEIRVPLQEQNMQDIVLSSEATATDRNTPLVFEEAQDNEEFKVDGRRVIDFMYFFEELQKISKHNSPLGCDFSHLQLLKEVCELWELAKQKCMDEAAKEEYVLAMQNGDVDANG